MRQHDIDEEEAIQRELLATAATLHEQALLGKCFLSEDVRLKAIGALRPEDFYRYQHRFIFEAMASLVEQRVPFSIVDLRDELQAKGRLDQVGGWTYLMSLDESEASSAGVDRHIERIKTTSVRRQLKVVSEAFRSLALDPEEPDPINKAIGLLLGIEAGKEVSRVRHISDVIMSKVAEVEQAYEARKRGDAPTVIASGFHDLDNKVLLTPQKLIILAARPAMGKSAMAFNIACHVAQSRPVLHVTLEMSGEELASRLIAADLDINPNAQAYGLVDEAQWADLMAYSERYRRHKLYIDDSPAATIEGVEAAALRTQASLREPLGLLVIDYLGLLDADGKDDTAKITKISRGAKRLAKSLNVPVLMLAQLNRGVEGREDKRPQMSDLRQSGAIEQDADVVMFAYRDEYYDPKTDKKGLAELLIRKNRGGSTGTVWLKFDAAKTQFSSVVYDPEEGPYGP